MDSGKMNTDSPISSQTTSFNQPSGNRQTSILPDMQDCTLCPRECHADRTAGQTGFCGQSEQIMAARAALHFWEEPCLSGTNGSGTVFSAAVICAVSIVRTTPSPRDRPVKESA